MSNLRIVKLEPEAEQRMVWAEVYAPNRPDSDGEFMSADTIRKMAYNFLRNGRTKFVDVGHDNKQVEGVEIVESFIARKGDPDFLEGAWVVGCHIDDDATWAKVQKGEINGFSVEAFVSAEEQEVEIDLPPVITGLTSKSEDHVHKFYVSYDESNGQFKGGTTDEVNGHVHAIRAGTVTEIVKGHSHRFSSVDQVYIV